MEYGVQSIVVDYKSLFRWHHLIRANTLMFTKACVMGIRNAANHLMSKV